MSTRKRTGMTLAYEDALTPARGILNGLLLGGLLWLPILWLAFHS